MLKLPGTEAARYVEAFLGVHATKLRAGVRDKDRGASAVELAVITARSRFSNTIVPFSPVSGRARGSQVNVRS